VRWGHFRTLVLSRIKAGARSSDTYGEAGGTPIAPFPGRKCLLRSEFTLSSAE